MDDSGEKIIKIWFIRWKNGLGAKKHRDLWKLEVASSKFSPGKLQVY